MAYSFGRPNASLRRNILSDTGSIAPLSYLGRVRAFTHSHRIWGKVRFAIGGHAIVRKKRRCLEPTHGTKHSGQHPHMAISGYRPHAMPIRASLGLWLESSSLQHASQGMFSGRIHKVWDPAKHRAAVKSGSAFSLASLTGIDSGNPPFKRAWRRATRIPLLLMDRSIHPV